MSDANLKLVQNLYAAYGRGDIQTVVAGMAPDCRWEVVGRKQDHPLFGVHSGPAGVKGFFENLAQLQQVSSFTPHEFFAAEDRVFVLGHYEWTMLQTKKPAASDWIHVFTVRDGKVTSFREFTDTAMFAEALR